jgi:hypothetical protein
MLKKSLRLYSISTLMVSCLFLVSCGKKTKSESPRLEPSTPPVVTELDEYLSKQDVGCDVGVFCPEYIVKIVVVEGSKRRVCTGFLTDSETVATSTSCLPSLMRLENQSCVRDVFFFFPKTFNSSSIERRSCNRVLKVSQLETDNPTLWKDDLAFLSLSEPINRRSLFPTREGMTNKSSLTMWSVDKMDEQFALIRRDTCEVVHNSYFNPLAINEFSAGMTVAGCKFKNGNSGSPLIDEQGLVRGVVTTTADQRLIDYVNNSGLLSAPLKPIQNATNFSCAPTIYDSDVASETECSKTPSYRSQDEARAQMLSFSTIFAPTLQSIKTQVEASNKFVRFSVKTANKNEDQQVVSITPKCFKDVPTWIDTVSGSKYIFSVSLPNKTLKKTMDAYGRIRGQEIAVADEVFKFQFSPNFLRARKYANLYQWNNTTDLTFENFSICE